MSSEKQNINVLENFISKPNSLEAERVGRSFFLDNNADVIPNEGNLLSLLTLQKFYKDDSNGVLDAIKQIGERESKYLVEAMKILSVEKDDSRIGDTEYLAARKLQQKFGSNFNASIGLASMLKNKSEQVEFDNLINPIVKNLSTTTKANTFV